MFGSQLGIEAVANIAEDSIETDVSIIPISDIVTETVVSIPDRIDTQYYLKTASTVNAEILFKKAVQTTTYTRSFNRIDDYFSYVGGLVGTIIGLFFIMGPYTEKAFEVSLAKKVLLDNN
jgi:hypothetical protein